MADHEDAEDQLRDFAQKLDAGPMMEVPVVGTEKYKDKDALMVLEGGKRMLVFPAFKLNPLPRIGDTVLLHAKAYLIIGPTGRRARGRVMRVSKVNNDRILVSSQVEERWVEASHLDTQVKPGFRACVLDDWTVTETWEEPNPTQLIERPTLKFSDVGGLEEAKLTLRKALEWPRKHKESYAKLGIRAGGGVLLFGAPGVGKTYLAKAVAGENNAAFFSVKISDILNKFVGESEANIQRLFQAAREHAPSVLFLDEFDAIGTTRTDDTNGHIYGAIVGQMLAEMDGLQERGNVMVIAATNRPDLIDPAFKRPGRFDHIIGIPRPDEKQAVAIAKIHLPDGLPYEDGAREVRDALVAALFKTKDIKVSGALIEGIANEAKIQAIQRCPKNPAIGVCDIEAAIPLITRK